MEYSIFLALLVESKVLTKDKAKKIYAKMRYKNFPLDFDQTLAIVKGVFDMVDSEEKLDKKLAKTVATKK